MCLDRLSIRICIHLQSRAAIDFILFINDNIYTGIRQYHDS